MSEFTRGPWNHEIEGGDEGFIRSKSGNRLWIASTVDIPSRDGGEKATSANGRLIAAAPELLEALQVLRSFMWSEGYADQTAAMAQADAAIRKAEGL